jgi:hypothetical protein
MIARAEPKQTTDRASWAQRRWWFLLRKVDSSWSEAQETVYEAAAEPGWDNPASILRIRKQSQEQEWIVSLQ